MKQLLWLLFVSLFAELLLSLEAERCSYKYKGGYPTSFCCDTTSGKTCLTTFLGTNNHTVRKPFEEASRWCRSAVPGSSLIIINGPESKSTVVSFIGRQILENETIIIDAQKLSINESLEWSWVNGHPIIPIDVTTRQSYDGACVESKHGQSLVYCVGNVSSQYRYVCEYSDSKSAFSRPNRESNKSYNVSEGVDTWYDARKNCLGLGGDLAFITDLRAIENLPQLNEMQTQRYWIGLYRNMWIWNSTGAALTYTNWADGYPDESSDKQCICINPQCRTENNQTICEVDRKWRTCNCNLNYAIVCQKEDKSDAVTTTKVVTEEMLLSTSGDVKLSVAFPVDTSTQPPPSSLSTAVAVATTTNSTNLETGSTIRSIPPVTVVKTRPATSTKTPMVTTTTTANISTKSSIATTVTSATTSAKPPIATTPTRTITSTATYIATTPTTATTREIDRKTSSSSSMTQKPSNHFAENQTTAASLTEQLSSFSTKEILLVILLLVAAVFIVAAVIVIIRKRKYDRRTDGSPMMNTKQSVYATVYATVVPAKRPSEGTVPPNNTIYTDVEMIKQPTPPTSNTIYASVQPTSEAVDMHGKTVVYADLNIPQKDQHKPSSADKITVSLSPIYSQPYNPPTPASNTEYAEPFKPDKTHTATAPVLNPIPAGEAIPMGDPSVIYSEVNKPTKSSTPVDKAVKATDPIYLEAIEVKPGVGSGGVATQDPSAVYAEPIKLEKLP